MRTDGHGAASLARRRSTTIRRGDAVAVARAAAAAMRVKIVNTDQIDPHLPGLSILPGRSRLCGIPPRSSLTLIKCPPSPAGDSRRLTRRRGNNLQGRFRPSPRA